MDLTSQKCIINQMYKIFFPFCIRSIGVVLCLLFTGVPAFSDPSEFSRTYPLPITEMQDVISKWFRDSDFKILRVDQELSQARLRAESQKKVWEVCLSQQSPLATQVTICKNNGGVINPELKNRFWNYITEYVNDLEIQVSNPHQKIPAAVMAHMEAVVCIEATVAGETYQASGFIINNNGRVRIISTAHNIRDFKKINVILHDGSEIPGRILKMDFHRDLTLIQINEKLVNFISLANGRSLLETDEKLYSVSCPINLNQAVYSGSVTAPKRVDDLILWQVQMKIHPGSSGSPVFDKHGNLVAIIKGRYRGTDSVGFLIPFETLMEFFQEMLLNE